MIKVILLVKRKRGMSMADFRDYYENHHSKRGARNFPHMASYRRNYLTPIGNGPERDAEPPFDCMTETCFESEDDYQKAMTHFVGDPAEMAAHHADEENLFDRSEIWTFLADECITKL